MAKKNDPINIIGILVSLWLISGGNVGGCNLPIISEPPPFKADKLCVLVVHETLDSNSYTPGQREAMQAVDGPGSIRGYVSGKGGEYFLLDKDQQPTAAMQPWVAEALKVRGDKLPWIVAASPSTGFTKQLPATAEETIAALKKIGGP